MSYYIYIYIYKDFHFSFHTVDVVLYIYIYTMKATFDLNFDLYQTFKQHEYLNMKKGLI